MKQVEKISLASVPFSIEKEACDKLYAYLSGINAHYKEMDGGNEIIEGIEERMAELFREKTSDEGVVGMELVEEVIKRMGKPSDMDSEIPEDGKRPSVSKRLYRDIDSKVLFGVCSGLAAYLNIDKVYLRLIFLALLFLGFFTDGVFFGVAVFLYLAFAISMPAAVTVEDRCRMYGDSVDIAGIEEKVKYRSDSGRHSVRSKKGTSVVASVIVKLLGVLVLLTGISGLVAGSLTALWTNMLNDYVSHWADLEFMELYSVYVLPMLGNIWFMILMYLVVLIPFIWMIYCGLKLIFGFKSPKWHPGLVMVFAWLALVITMLVVVSCNVYEFWYFYNL